MRLAGKVAVVTGAAGGMGAFHVRALAAEGASVVIADVDESAGRLLADEVGVSARFTRLDVRNREDWQRAAALAEHEFGGIDVLVNNAGIFHRGAFEEHTPQRWAEVLETNVTGAWNGMQACLPALTRASAASVINVSSVTGLRGYPNMSAYSTSKHALVGLTKSAALDLGVHGIRVNSVHPGHVRTAMTSGLGEDVTRWSALHRTAEAHELSSLIVFLASDESSFATGATFVFDGGETAGQAAEVSA